MKLIPFIIFLIFNNVIKAETINVPDSYSTIQAAINASSDFDTVLVSAGFYQENIDFNGKNTFFSYLPHLWIYKPTFSRGVDNSKLGRLINILPQFSRTGPMINKDEKIQVDNPLCGLRQRAGIVMFWCASKELSGRGAR